MNKKKKKTEIVFIPVKNEGEVEELTPCPNVRWPA